MTAPLKIPHYLAKKVADLIVALFNRKPNRRIGGREEAKEVKRHPWFSDFDWNIVAQRGLKPPKPRLKEISKELLPYEIFGSLESNNNKVEGWEYVNKNAI